MTSIQEIQKIQPLNEEIRHLVAVLNTDNTKICCVCKSTETYVKKNGYESWLSYRSVPPDVRDPDVDLNEILCQRCFQRLYSRGEKSRQKYIQRAKSYHSKEIKITPCGSDICETQRRSLIIQNRNGYETCNLCRDCGVWWLKPQYRCPCCSHKLATGPRQKKEARKYIE